MNQMCKEELLHYIDLVSFQVMDAQLFLDTHPDCEEAERHFRHFLELRDEAMKLYAMKFGPLTIDSMVVSDGFGWADMPLPWEGGCL